MPTETSEATVIDETLFEAEEKMEKAVTVARDELARPPHRPGHPGDVRPHRRRLLRRADADPAAGLGHRPRAADGVIKPYDTSQLGAIEKAIRDSDLGVNPTNDGKIIRVVFPQLTEERRTRAGQGRPAQGRGRQGLDPQRPPARQGRARQAGQGRRGRRGRRRTAPRSELDELTADATSATVDELRQAQGSRAARGLMPAIEERRPAVRESQRRAAAPGRNLPAAIGVGARRWAR